MYVLHSSERNIRASRGLLFRFFNLVCDGGETGPVRVRPIRILDHSFIVSREYRVSFHNNLAPANNVFVGLGAKRFH